MQITHNSNPFHSHPFGMLMDGRSYTSEKYRWGFNGKEKDIETQTQDYGFRIYNPRLCRFLSIDPLTKAYPFLTPYQFASNTPTSGIDLDGLEYYYTADGKFLFQGNDRNNKEVRLAKTNGKTKSGQMIVKAVDLEGNDQRKWVIIHNNHDEFKAMASVLYAEADGTTSEAVNEVAGIYSVLENRAKHEKTTVKAQMTVAKGVYGAVASEADKINQADNVGMTAKKEAVFAGLILGILSETDFSNGAFFWDGKDFNKGGGNNERYKPGYEFCDPSHDLFKKGDNLVKGSNTFKMGKDKTITKSWDYKYESTGAFGKTTFSKLTDKYRNAQHPSKKADELGNLK